VADLEAMMRAFEAVHPNLYAVRSRETTSGEREKLEAGVPESMTRVEWWTRLSRFVAGFGDGHTNVQFPGEEFTRDTGALLFPSGLTVDHDRLPVVTLSFAPPGALRRGDRIVEINGQDAGSLVRQWMGEFSGESEETRAAAVGDSFLDLLLMHSIRAPFVVKVEGMDGSERGATLAGITREELKQRFRPGGGGGAAKGTNYQGFSYRVLETGIGYINLRSFGGDLPQFQKDAAAVFRQIAADHDRKLIIDLRQNPGGDSRLADELLRYLTAKPYRMYSRKDWKMSAEYRAYLKSFIVAPLRWLPLEKLSGMGRELFDGPAGRVVSMEEKLTTPKRTEPFFSGWVCMLIGPRTFSSATDLADAVKTYHLATLVGEETGGRPNTFGEVYPFVLPRSGFVMSVSSAYYLRASGEESDHRGVMPEVVAAPTREDVRASRDVALERAKAME
jgi:hypothetical protein